MKLSLNSLFWEVSKQLFFLINIFSTVIKDVTSQGFEHKQEMHPLTSTISSIPWGHWRLGQFDAGQFLFISNGTTSLTAASPATSEP